MKKNSKIHIALSTELKDRLIRKAEESGLSLSAYCLVILSNSRISIEFTQK